MTLCNILTGKEKGKQWMLASADKRATVGIEAEDYTRKITPLADNIFFVSAGVLNTSYEAFLAGKKNLEEYTRPAIKKAAYLIYGALQEEINSKTFGGQKKRPVESLSVLAGIAGIDVDGEAIYSIFINPIGDSDIARQIEPFLSIGSGATVAAPAIKKWVKYFGGENYSIPVENFEMSIEEGIKCLTYAHIAAADYTPTISEDFEIQYIETNNSKIKPKKIDALPVKEMKKEFKANKELFELQRSSPEKLEGFLKSLKK